MLNRLKTLVVVRSPSISRRKENSREPRLAKPEPQRQLNASQMFQQSSPAMSPQRGAKQRRALVSLVAQKLDRSNGSPLQEQKSRIHLKFNLIAKIAKDKFHYNHKDWSGQCEAKRALTHTFADLQQAPQNKPRLVQAPELKQHTKKSYSLLHN